MFLYRVVIALEKRGQGSAGGAAALIAIIGALLLLFVVFMPPEERAELLDQTYTGTNGGGGGVSDVEAEELLVRSPGKVDYLSLTSVEHNVPSIYLISKTEAYLVDEFPSVYVKNALFTNVVKNLTFSLVDIENTKNVLLAFNVFEGQGPLRVLLNGEEIFSGGLSKGNVAPLKLHDSLLEEENVLSFYVESPGFAFWATNEYTLTDLRITADVTDVEGRRSSSTFLVDAQEKEYLKRVLVRFLPECQIINVGRLRATLNGNVLINAIPDCGTVYRQELDTTYLVAGENEIRFTTEEGSYFVDQIKITGELRRPRDYIYNFHVNKSMIEDVDGNVGDVYLHLEFDDYYFKDAELIINGHLTHLSTEDIKDVRKISRYIKEGSNYVKITPQSTMYVGELKVDFADADEYDDLLG